MTMFTNLRLARIAAAAAILLVPTVSGLSTAAFADDEYGVATAHGALIRQSAESAPSVAAVAALATEHKPVMTMAMNAAHRASDAPAVSNSDLLGSGGKQDELAREIYQPGTGTDW
jgi:hypothetical protein